MLSLIDFMCWEDDIGAERKAEKSMTIIMYGNKINEYTDIYINNIDKLSGSLIYNGSLYLIRDNDTTNRYRNCIIAINGKYILCTESNELNIPSYYYIGNITNIYNLFKIMLRSRNKLSEMKDYLKIIDTYLLEKRNISGCIERAEKIISILINIIDIINIVNKYNKIKVDLCIDKIHELIMKEPDFVKLLVGIALNPLPDAKLILRLRDDKCKVYLLRCIKGVNIPSILEHLSFSKK